MTQICLKTWEIKNLKKGKSCCVFAFSLKSGYGMFSCELQVPCKFSLACCRSGNKGLVRSRVCFQHGELYRSLDDWHDYKYNKPIVDSFLHNFHSNIHQVVRGSVELFLQLLHLHYCQATGTGTGMEIESTPVPGDDSIISQATI